MKLFVKLRRLGILSFSFLILLGGLARAGWIQEGLYPESLKKKAVFGGGEGSQVRVFFGMPPYSNPGGLGLREGIAETFDSAEVSIRAAFFQINDPSFIDALIRAVERGVRVELATDRCYRIKKGYQEELDRLAAAMDRAGQPSSKHLVDDGTESCDADFNHNKYAVIDLERGAEAKTWVGSYNVTEHGAEENFDLSFLVDGAELAQILARDHEQMMAGQYQVAKKTVLQSSRGIEVLSKVEPSSDLRYPRVRLGSGENTVEIEVLISPKSKSLRRIIEEVYAAKKEVLFSTFAIGDAMLVSALINKYSKDGAALGENQIPVLLRAESWEKADLKAIVDGKKVTKLEGPSGAASVVRDLFSEIPDEADNYTIGRDPKTAKLKTVFQYVYPKGAAGGLVQKVKMLGIFGNKNVGGSAPWDRLVAAGVPMLRNTAKGELHNKLFLIDSQTLIVGSHNFSQSADNGNDEVTLIIKSPAMGRLVRDHYLMPTRHFTAPNERALASAAERYFHDYREAQLLITEVHAGLGVGRGVDEQGEFIEIYNAGDQPVQVLGLRISTAFFPKVAGERVRKVKSAGVENEIVGYVPPATADAPGTPVYDPKATLLEPKRFALIVGREFRREHYQDAFRQKFKKLYSREPTEAEHPLLLTTGGFFSKGVGGAQGIAPWSRITLLGLDGVSVIDRFEYPEIAAPELR